VTVGRDSKAPLVYVDEKSVKALQDIARVIKAQGSERPSPLTKMLNEEIREAAEPMRRAIAAEARALNFTRQGRTMARSGKGRRLKSGKRAKQLGLRDEIAKGIRTQISSGAYTAGVRVRTASKKPDINALATRINHAGFIRHPTRMGPNWRAINRKKWAQTNTTNGQGWFYRAAEPHTEMVSRRVRRVLDRWVDKMARDINRAA
jgi:hypothetical protein